MNTSICVGSYTGCDQKSLEAAKMAGSPFQTSMSASLYILDCVVETGAGFLDDFLGQMVRLWSRCLLWWKGRQKAEIRLKDIVYA